MLTFSCARAVLAKVVSTWLAARMGAAATLSVVMLITTWTAARADGVLLGSCIGSPGFFGSHGAVRSQGAVNCVIRWGGAGDPYIRTVPEPVGQAERERSAERERKWEARCKPVIAQDGYGVPRYRFSAPGCEFGIYE